MAYLYGEAEAEEDFYRYQATGCTNDDVCRCPRCYYNGPTPEEIEAQMAEEVDEEPYEPYEREDFGDWGDDRIYETPEMYAADYEPEW